MSREQHVGGRRNIGRLGLALSSAMMAAIACSDSDAPTAVRDAALKGEFDPTAV